MVNVGSSFFTVSDRPPPYPRATGCDRVTAIPTPFDGQPPRRRRFGPELPPANLSPSPHGQLTAQHKVNWDTAHDANTRLSTSRSKEEPQWQQPTRPRTPPNRRRES
jgi:hypothetical protein